MSMFPKKNFFLIFDSLLPSKYIVKLRKFVFFEPFMGNDIANRGRLSHYGNAERKEFAKALKKIRDETELLLEDIEAYHIYMAVKRTQKVPGDIAEVGVYKGGSAKIICAVKGENPFTSLTRLKVCQKWMILIWSGLSTRESLQHRTDSVKDYLKNDLNVFFYKGIFPGTSGPVQEKTFSMVNLDVDTSESTKQCLEFFYNRMNQGGILISHDYMTAPGVKKAFDDFFDGEAERVLETAGSQCLVVKV